MEQQLTKPCSECGGRRVKVDLFPSVIVLKQGYAMPMFLTKSSKYSSIKAISCLKCGHISFYAEQPEKLIPDD